jgi:hypothetical protein
METRNEKNKMDRFENDLAKILDNLTDFEEKMQE